MKKIITLLIAILVVSSASAQFYSARVNALALLTGTIDVGADVAITDNITVDAALQLNPMHFKSRSLFLFGGEVGAKYWRYENFVGPFIASNIGCNMFEFGDENRRRDGVAYRWGVSYGYSWILSVRWSLAVEAGLGLCYAKYEEADTYTDDWSPEYIYHHKRLSLIPSRIGVTFNYLF